MSWKNLLFIRRSSLFQFIISDVYGALCKCDCSLIPHLRPLTTAESNSTLNFGMHTSQTVLSLVLSLTLVSITSHCWYKTIPTCVLRLSLLLLGRDKLVLYYSDIRISGTTGAWPDLPLWGADTTVTDSRNRANEGDVNIHRINDVGNVVNISKIATILSLLWWWCIRHQVCVPRHYSHYFILHYCSNFLLRTTWLTELHWASADKCKSKLNIEQTGDCPLKTSILWSSQTPRYKSDESQS